TRILKNTGMVPVFNHPDPDTAFRVVKACYDAGLHVFEWTNRGNEALSVFRQLVKSRKHDFPEMLLGTGSVYDGETAREFVSFGADFIVSPVLDPGLADTCKQLEVLWIPGTGTLTEIYQAQKWGADIIKIFPAQSIGGPEFVKAILGPMPWAQIMPTGGVTPDPDNLKAWFDSGVCGVGMGSKLFTKSLVENSDPGPLSKKIRQTLQLIESLRVTN
ncbi:MAG: bifunctional 4-hydroxy-2-oxoglutarate aldolase/2-dehydro-3-deoxy-phosphogluconate aldolase, partial [Bacteroidales bacterium]|nr:bifunctional 4-hydroxy-2-oxoglutarate aldolase/2-dehydro-3-deoxy-phosphogluconate aldolase [Bacteroidales bacterium]